MSFVLERRQWLKGTALAAAGLAVARGRLTAGAGTDAENADLVLLDQNENPYGISRSAMEAILDAIKLSHRYPGDETAALRDLIAKQEGVTKDHVILGAGSTEIFSLAAMLYGSEGKEVLLADPTYVGFKAYVERVKGKLNLVPVNSRYEHDLAAMAGKFHSGTSLVYVCNPNNPTGTIVDGSRLRPFCEEMSGKSMVFVDEAYNDLVEDP
ncbi:MAG: aminotransferase class I/II-fold pyridoxal phosphate-dependent enzyme, partial [Acidobacteria bacterium]|nr:aminotransferase class I/II-fold pyridoxal phosphate-dependent enzyme [Acidobacteriota bacterium]